MKTHIKGWYLIIGGIAFFVLGKALGNLFPKDIVAETVGAVTELSWWVFLVIGIIVLLRERRKKSKEDLSIVKNSEVLQNNIYKEEQDNLHTPNKDTSKKKFVILISLGVIIFGIVFYWFAIRPSSIKKECSQFIIKAYTQQERDDARKSYNDTSCSPPVTDMDTKFSCLKWEGIFNSPYTQDRRRSANDREYQQCLRENGL